MWGAVIGGAASLAGSLLGSSSAKSNAAASNKIMLDLAKNGMQYRVQDLRKAGLNPILAVNGSGGLGSVSSSGVQMAAPADFSGLTSSATGVYDAYTRRKQQQAAQAELASRIALQNAQVANSAADIRLKDAQAATQLEVAKNQNAQTGLLGQQVLTEAARRSNIEAQTGLASAQQIRTHYQTTQDRVLSEYLNTSVGAESARIKYDSSNGGISGPINGVVSGTTRLGSYFFGNSAKKVSKDDKGGPFPPNDYRNLYWRK
ncbi:hypothetical protein [Salmonella enterica]|uniref:hypothetical protein n=1 Tax=Salmonella enterica TaxID=28901 RepID=UPI0009AE9C4A|nr:hypothetical protein [Salmonella enterica]